MTLVRGNNVETYAIKKFNCGENCLGSKCNVCNAAFMREMRAFDAFGRHTGAELFGICMPLEVKRRILVLDLGLCDMQVAIAHCFPMDTWTIRVMIMDTLRAVSFCHSSGIAHLDVKPENLIIGKTGRILLTDFGCSCPIGVDSTQITSATATYGAPEAFIRGMKDITKLDMWSIGAVLLTTLLGTNKWTEATWRPLLKKQRGIRLGNMGMILDSCLSKRPSERLCAKDLLERVEVHELDPNVEAAARIVIRGYGEKVLRSRKAE
jgi:hypothetical protein